MALPVLRPGQTHPAVVKLKRAVIRELKERNRDELASTIKEDTRTYGRSAVRGVKRVQQDKQLRADGIVGERTWRALGFDEPVAEDHPPALNGIPWEPGLVAIDGRWVDKPLGERLLAARKAGRWRGVVNSGYRPAWYQKRLWDAAVRKYGSEQAAAKWVARPGRSRHGLKGGQGAVDVSFGDQLDASSESLFRPMSWEAWHVQLTGGRALPEEPAEPPDLDVPEADLEQQGVRLEDVDASVEEVLRQIDSPNDEGHEADEDADEDAYDPEAGEGAPTPEGARG